MKCDFCGSQSTRVKYVLHEDGRTRCKSETPCRRRMKERTHVKVQMTQPIRPDAMIGEFLARQRNIRNALYVNGLCCDCGRERYSPGRPRCEGCYRKYQEWQRYGYG